MDNLTIILIVCIVCIATVFFIGAIGVGEGSEKESLLDFSCEELESGISTNGKDGRFVTDWFSWNVWVPKELKREARITKGCYILQINLTKFDYKTFKKS